ncbi:hypothetical protein [Actinoplanes sp. NBRC 103695]|uniref:hypothetical protein n=1 Tax=Actinoplanes sp. NBRC 103695 TaxID=3032202 RepID=UPI00249FE29D|nr:hypothetical protein [Actinoplanes sp. NBRC 103695]GLY96088.1 hypothetical protein Acsp02_33430 [Actinoplanes sp. NBRC 103695]
MPALDSGRSYHHPRECRTAPVRPGIRVRKSPWATTFVPGYHRERQEDKIGGRDAPGGPRHADRHLPHPGTGWVTR